MSHISVHTIICFLPNFPIIVFNIYLFLIFTFLQLFSLPYLFISPLLLQLFSLPYLFISPLPFSLIPFFFFPSSSFYFCLFLFTPSYYKFVIVFSILCIIFPHKKGCFSLSLSLSIFWWNFYFSCISALG